MIIVDTNVVSEFMVSAPAPAVLNWLNAQESAELFLTSVSVAEVCFGLRAMPQGRRQRLLTERFEQFLELAFGSRILSFDEASARAYGEIRGHRREMGKPISVFDAQIAAIARTRRFAVATRNVRDFRDCGVELIDPFAEEHGADERT